MLVHFMATATLEAWLRLLSRGCGWGGLRRLIVVILAITASIAVNILVLPERLVIWLALRKLRRAERFVHEPGVVAILGYYRSGTTHLQNLLSCDRRFVTPRWVQVLAPQGFWLSWTPLSLFMTPIMGGTRPHDAVGFGPQWPAEDDFAMNNWGLASSLPGRLLVPSQMEHYARWQFMDELSDAERSRWRGLMAIFCWKVTRRHPSRTLLLKSPSHTCRVEELRRLFGDRIRFIVIDRDRDEVIASNLSMSRHLGYMLLERQPEESELRTLLERDHDRSLAAMESQFADVPEQRIARISYSDLRASPTASIRRAYESIGLTWTDQFEASLVRYLQREGRYTPRHAKDSTPVGQQSHAAGKAITQKQRLMGFGAGLIAGGVGLAIWLLLAQSLQVYLAPSMWAIGFAIGLSVGHAAGRGDVWMGMSATAILMSVVLMATYALPEVAYGWTGPRRWESIGEAYGGLRLPIWVVLSAATCYRCASRRHVSPPGFRQATTDRTRPDRSPAVPVLGPSASRDVP